MSNPSQISAQSLVGASAPVLSFSPVVLPIAGRVVDLEMRVSAPATGGLLPIILLSHGHGPSNNLSSLNGYGPLANFWAAHGFVVIQPTHLSSRTLSLQGPDAPLFWRSRVEDMKCIIDHLDQIEMQVPTLSGRLDKTRVAVAGHSMGGHTASLLLGMRLINPADHTEVDLKDPRIKAGVLLAAPGSGGADLSAYAAQHYPVFSRPSFRHMTTPALVVAGDADISTHLTVRGADWFADPYFLSTGPKCLLTLFGAKHGLGGVSGYDAAETTDENTHRVGVVQHITTAYVRSVLYPEKYEWTEASASLSTMPGALGSVQCK